MVCRKKSKSDFGKIGKNTFIISDWYIDVWQFWGISITLASRPVFDVKIAKKGKKKRERTYKVLNDFRLHENAR